MSDKGEIVRYFDRDNNKDIVNIELTLSAEISVNRLDLRDVRLFITK